jgi:hypothetical protein
MVADKYERYEVSYVPEGLHIFAWQALPNLGGGVIALVLLAACFATDTHGDHGRVWVVIGVAALALVALFGVRMENWVFSESEVRYKGSLWRKDVSFRPASGTPLTLRVESATWDPDGTEPPFPHVIRVIGPGGNELGDGFRFRQRRKLVEFLEMLRTVTALEVVEVRSRVEDPGESGKPPADLEDSWLD